MIVTGTSILNNNTTLGSSLTVSGNTILGNKLFFTPYLVQTPVSNDEINTYSTLNFVTPTNNLTDIIFQEGSSIGQIFILVNNSNYNITMQNETSSKVANGDQITIYNKTTLLFVWDGLLWYPTAL